MMRSLKTTIALLAVAASVAVTAPAPASAASHKGKTRVVVRVNLPSPFGRAHAGHHRIVRWVRLPRRHRARMALDGSWISNENGCYWMAVHAALILQYISGVPGASQAVGMTDCPGDDPQRNNVIYNDSRDVTFHGTTLRNTSRYYCEFGGQVTGTDNRNMGVDTDWYCSDAWTGGAMPGAVSSMDVGTGAGRWASMLDRQEVSD